MLFPEGKSPADTIPQIFELGKRLADIDFEIYSGKRYDLTNSQRERILSRLESPELRQEICMNPSYQFNVQEVRIFFYSYLKRLAQSYKNGNRS